MHNDPLTSLVFIVALIILIYYLGLWAGRNLERHIVADRLKELQAIEKAKRDNRNQRRRY
tara:strand:- start:60 stop:239 length:180 start_codon:yes stop_codon:yes gene_type:complete